MDIVSAKAAILTQRETEMQEWLQAQWGEGSFQLTPLAGDASFRRYFRAIHEHNQSYVVMDAPPAREDCRPFVALARLFREQGVLTPRVYAENLDRGFLLLEDFGDELLLNHLNHQTVDKYYRQAMQELLRFSRIKPSAAASSYSLALYDASLLQQEMRLFLDWYLQAYRQLRLSSAQIAELDSLFDLLANSALAQPQVCVHRDFHSRNLLVWGKCLSVIDFQDAVIGPVTYDLVSLLKDCYIAWPEEKVRAWVAEFYAQLPEALRGGDLAEFQRAFDWMGVQRHLKCLGIFARLSIRDHKPNYLSYLPTVRAYLRAMVEQYQELVILSDYLME
jgi:hypothetical protein